MPLGRQPGSLRIEHVKEEHVFADEPVTTQVSAEGARLAARSALRLELGCR
jgi:hypothetical protein